MVNVPPNNMNFPNSVPPHNNMMPPHHSNNMMISPPNNIPVQGPNDHPRGFEEINLRVPPPINI